MEKYLSDEQVKQKKEALEILENVKDRLQFVLDEIKYIAEEIEDAKTDVDLADALQLLSQSVDEAQYAADDINEAYSIEIEYSDDIGDEGLYPGIEDEEEDEEE